MEIESKDIARLLSAATYNDFTVITADFSHAAGFYIEVPTGGGTVIGKTFAGTAFSASFREGYHPIRMKSITFTGSVAGIKALFNS
jgi:hypothetical protein